MKITENFSLEEFTKSNIKGIENNPDEIFTSNIIELARNVLQPIRNKFGSVRIMSGYRCEKYNKAIGGATNSQHMKGEAADIQTEAELSEVFAWVKRSGLLVDQCIFENKNGTKWIHISYSKTKNRKQFMTAEFVNGKAIYKNI